MPLNLFEIENKTILKNHINSEKCKRNHMKKNFRKKIPFVLNKTITQVKQQQTLRVSKTKIMYNRNLHFVYIG